MTRRFRSIRDRGRWRVALSGAVVTAALVVGSTVAGVLVSPTPAAASSIGVSPSSIRFDNALRGGEYRASISVFTDSTTPSKFLFEREGAAASWLTFYDALSGGETPVDSVVAPPAGADGSIGIKLNVPDGTPNGTYQAIVTVFSDINKGDQTSGPVNVGAQVGVSVDVTGTQSLSATLLDAAPVTSRVEVGQPVRFAAQIQNTGNVDIVPDLAVTIVASGGPLTPGETVSETSDPIRTGETNNVNVSWNTRQADVGDYTAVIRATAGSLVIGERTVNLSLVPEGTLRRNGELRSLTVATPASVGGSAKVVAEFANTGEIDAEATFQGELWRGDQLLGSITSPPLLVDPGSIGDLAFVVGTPDSGEYRVIGLVNFNGKETERRELIFDTGDSGGLGIGWFIGLGVGVALVLGAGAVILARRRP